MDKIILPDIRVLACHGCNPEEKTTPQPFCLGLILFLDLGPAGRSDDLAATVDYGRLYLAAKDLAERRSFDLIEALAEALAALALADPRVVGTCVRVEKCQARAGDAVFPARVEIQRWATEDRA